MRISDWSSDVCSSDLPAGASAQLVVGGETITVPLEGVIDIAAERDRLSKALAAATKERDSPAARLAHPAFVERAKPEAGDKARTEERRVGKEGVTTGRARW